MALLVDKETEKDLNERLEEFLKFGMVLNYMIDIDEENINDLEKMLFDSDRDKATLKYTRIIKKVKSDYESKAFTIYSHEFPNDKDFDDEKYLRYLNKCCFKNLISKFSNSKKIDKTYINTYNYLLSK